MSCQAETGQCGPRGFPGGAMQVLQLLRLLRSQRLDLDFTICHRDGLSQSVSSGQKQPAMDKVERRRRLKPYVPLNLSEV